MKLSEILMCFLLILALASCHKDEGIPDYCYQFIHSSSDSVILPEQDIAAIRVLFEANNIAYGNYQFYSFMHDETGFYHIAVLPYMNGLKILGGYLAFHFDSTGKLLSVNGDTISGIPLDTIPLMNPVAAIRLYIQELNRDQQPPYPKEEIKYGCFDAEFGYYDLNYTNSTGIRNFTKAWKVTPKGATFPYAYINDMTSKMIVYSNGIIIN
jgi:Zn-dependent metalloprotease